MATISINAVFGENGLIKKAQQAKELHENAAREEEEALNTLLGEYENALNGGGSEGSNPEPTTSPTPTIPPEYKDETLPETAEPKVTDGMTRVKYDISSSKWVKVDKNEATGEVGAWYNYSDSTAKDGIAAKSWANVVIPSDGYTTSSLFNSSGELNENANYIQLVWIPRYAYKITSQYHNNPGNLAAGNIDIVFIGTDNKGANGTGYSESYPSVTDAGTATGKMNDFVVHPAFNFGTDKLGGFWVGKFETSTNVCTNENAAYQTSYSSSETIRVKSNISSRRGITIGNMFELTQKMKSNSVHGLSSTSIDPHLMKNDEWGACAYLSKSKYGKQTEEVWINNSSSYITGSCGNAASVAQNVGTTNDYKDSQGVKASTTGTVEGVYDMSGGTWEYVAAYLGSGNSYGGTLISCDSKYKNVYPSEYPAPTIANKLYGDAIYETSEGTSGSNSWYGDYSYFPNSSYVFFKRGGGYGDTTDAGVFYFGYDSGISASYYSFRVVVPVLDVD